MINLKAQIKEILIYDSVNTKEYQDIYYFVKKLRLLLPDIPEDRIYKAINFTNRSFQSPVNKNKYVDLLINKLLNFNSGLSKNGIWWLQV